MRRMWICCALLAMAVLLLTGCNMRTIDELYQVPKRSEAYQNLQSVIDGVMAGLEYSSPISGENRQTVQMADLDGDGDDEYLLFAKGSAEKPLQIFIFSGDGEEYTLVDTIESTGSAFDQVEYVRMDNRGGYELVVGRQLSDQVVRSVSVYRMVGGQMEQMMTANYSKFVCTDLNGDKLSDLLILRPGESESDNGVAELYSVVGGAIERSNEINMSEPSDRIKRIIVSALDGGQSAVFVASDVDSSAIITDIFAILDHKLTNVTFSNESGTSVQTLRNYYVYADDIDNDGILELPSLITMKSPENVRAAENQYLIRWYAMTINGGEVNKKYTYHNYMGGWYMELNGEYAPRTAVLQRGNSYEFYVWDEAFSVSEKVVTIHALTGQKREEQAVTNNRFVVYRTEATVYAAELEVASGAYGMSKEGLINSFHLIIQDWNTGET